VLISNGVTVKTIFRRYSYSILNTTPKNMCQFIQHL